MPITIVPPPAKSAGPEPVITKPPAVELIEKTTPTPGPKPFTAAVFGKDETKREQPKAPDAPAKPDEKKAEATPPTPPAADDDAPAELKGNEKQMSRWKQLRMQEEQARKERDEFKTKYETETKTLGERAAQVEKELTETKARFNPEEYERLKTEREELFQKVRLLDVTRTPEWQKEFNVPMERAVKHVVAQVAEENKAKVEWLLKQPPSNQRTEALEEIASDMGPLRAGQIGIGVAAYDDVRSRMEAVLADEKNLVERHTQFQKEQDEANQAASKLKVAKEFEATFETVKKDFAESGLPIFTRIEGNEAHNAEVEKAINEAKSLAQNDDRAVRTRLAFGAVMGKHAVTALNAIIDENKKLTEMVAQFQRGLPSGQQKGADNGEQKVQTDRPFSATVFGR